MGWDPSFFLDHSLKFKNAAELVEVFGSLVDGPVFVEIYSSEKGEENKLAPESYDGWCTHYHSGKTLEDELKEGILQFYKPKPLDEELWISEKSVMFDSEELYLGRWGYMIHLFQELSTCSTEQLLHNHFQEKRKVLYKWAKLLGSTQYIIFCSDSNQDADDYLWTHHSIEEVLEKYKQRWVVVEYSSIQNFKYEEEMYSRVIFIDRFEGLK